MMTIEKLCFFYSAQASIKYQNKIPGKNWNEEKKLMWQTYEILFNYYFTKIIQRLWREDVAEVTQPPIGDCGLDTEEPITYRPT